mmetsp:Transcript_148823/g.211372  ORF Transcript_148823/g.211372 Transcript_148823/m.211372 type:complete len:154 (+) Transcript_148823:43-504(+)
MEDHFLTQNIKFFQAHQAYGEFANFYPSPVLIDERKYPTVEHFYQSQKFVGVNDNLAEKIRRCGTPSEARAIATSTDVTVREDWADVKYSVLMRGLTFKFQQHERLKQLLQGTENKGLIFDATHDSDLGIGEGDGENNLGKALSELRAKVKKE